MSSGPPSISSGPPRGLQTYLGSAVRPTAPTAAPAAAPAAGVAVPVAAPLNPAAAGIMPPPVTTAVAAPVAQPIGMAAPSEPLAASIVVPAPVAPVAVPTAAAPASLFGSTSSASDLFSTPALFPPAASSTAADHLSSLLGGSVDSTSSSLPRPSVFGPGEVGGFAISASPPPSAAAAQRSSPSVSAAPSPSLLSTSPSPAAMRLEKTSVTEHPLLGPPAPLASPSPPAAVQAQQPAIASTLAPAPLSAAPLQPAFPAGMAPARSTPPLPVRPLRPSVSAATAPAGSMQQPVVPTTAVVAPTPQVAVAAPAVAPEPPASPDEKLSNLLQQLFAGPAPPPKLQRIDVSTVPRTLDGLATLADAGLWRETLSCAEALLQSRGGLAAPLPFVPHSHPPHEHYRIAHYLVSAALRLRRTDQAAATMAQLGNLFAADKLYASHPSHYPEDAATAAASTGGSAPVDASRNVGNMVPFELHVLAAMLTHAQGRTRAALDQLLRIGQWLRACVQRKQQAQASAAPGAEPRAEEAAPSPRETRGSLSDSSSNPLSLTSAHTLSGLTLAQLSRQQQQLRVHLANLCLSFASSSDLDYPTAEATLLDAIRAEEKTGSKAHIDLWLALVRVRLQVGDLSQAEAALQQAKATAEAAGEKDHLQCALHDVFVLLARHDFAGAYTRCAALHASHPSDIDVANNLAVCALYSNHNNEAITALEQLIRNNPNKSVVPSTLSNLRALYDLRASNPTLKRRMMQGLALMYADDDVEFEAQ